MLFPSTIHRQTLRPIGGRPQVPGRAQSRVQPALATFAAPLVAPPFIAPLVPGLVLALAVALAAALAAAASPAAAQQRPDPLAAEPSDELAGDLADEPGIAQTPAAAPVRVPQLNPTQRLFDAVQANDYAAAQASLAAGAKINARDQWGLSPIDLAVDKGYFEIAHFLLSARNFQRDEDEPTAIPRRRDAASAARGPSPVVRHNTQRSQPASVRETGVDSEQVNRARVEPWPKGSPNPFDPKVPAPGAALPHLNSLTVGGETAAVGEPRVR